MKPLDKNLVSVLMPCYNAEQWIGEAIESVLSQSWEKTELVVVDDASTDNSRTEISRFTKHGITVVQATTPFRSAARARNEAFRHCNGSYIKYFDADDVLHPRMIERQMEKIGGSKNSIAFAGWGRFYNNDLSTFRLNYQNVWRDMNGPDWLIESWLDARPMMQPGMFLIPREHIEKNGGWDEDLSLIDDFEFFARILCNAQLVGYTPDAPLYYRSGLLGSLSASKTDMAVLSAYHAIIKGTSHLLSCRDDAKSRLACANMMQDFVYSYYPEHQELTKDMTRRIASLSGSSLICDGTPRFNQLRRLLGWKVAKRLEKIARAALSR